MCGITGFQGGDRATHVALCMTLCQLSRGVDGAGVAFVHEPNHTLHVVKTADHPMTFANDFDFFQTVEAKSAICHNRMPSRGKVEWKNSHPFFDCKKRFALIHNGSIYDTETHNKRLKEAGHQIQGDTDSEVYAHLICEQLDNGKTILEALRAMITAREVATVMLIDKEGVIYGLKGHNPIEICEMRRGDERCIGLASEKVSIRNGVPNYKAYEHLWTDTEYGDIIVAKDGKLALIEHHPHKFTYNNSVSFRRVGDDEEWFLENGGIITRGGTGGRWGKTQRQTQLTTTTKTPHEKRLARIDRINELRRRRGLPELTPAEIARIVNKNCANEHDGCPTDCGKNNNNTKFACFRKEGEPQQRPSGCADYDRTQGCPATKCDEKEPCFRPKGCADWKAGTCPPIGGCLESRNCYRKIPTIIEEYQNYTLEVNENEENPPAEGEQNSSLATGAGNRPRSSTENPSED